MKASSDPIPKKKKRKSVAITKNEKIVQKRRLVDGKYFAKKGSNFPFQSLKPLHSKTVESFKSI